MARARRSYNIIAGRKIIDNVEAIGVGSRARAHGAWPRIAGSNKDVAQAQPIGGDPSAHAVNADGQGGDSAGYSAIGVRDDDQIITRVGGLHAVKRQAGSGGGGGGEGGRAREALGGLMGP